MTYQLNCTFPEEILEQVAVRNFPAPVFVGGDVSTPTSFLYSSLFNENSLLKNTYNCEYKFCFAENDWASILSSDSPLKPRNLTGGKMDKWSEGTVKANGIQIHYYRTGGDKPQIVMNHGAGDDGLCWTHVVKQLEQDYDVILPDARGHGKSSSGKGNYSTKERVADLKGLIDALKLDRPIVGGHSLGADTSLNFAAEYPDMTRGVFLEDPPVFLPGEKLGGDGDQVSGMDEIAPMIRKFFRTFKYLPKFIGIRMAKKAMPSYPDDEIYPWLNSKKRVSTDFINGDMAEMGLDPTSAFEAISRIQAPIVLFIGDKAKMSLMSVEAAQKAAEANSRLEITHLEGASHDIRRTRFDGYMPALRSFVDRIYAAN